MSIGLMVSALVVSCGRPANADETTIAPSGGAVSLVALDNADAVAGWTTVNDPVMGGKSTSRVAFSGGGLEFSGTLSLENNGGFASARSPQGPGIGQRAAGATALTVRAVGDGKTYVLKAGVAGHPWSYIQRFRTDAGIAGDYALPVAGFEPVGMRLDPEPNAPRLLDPSTIDEVAVYILDKQQGPFTITITGIDANP
ncbi:CIA30 family protein [Mycobacterium sp. C3-094]